ncbi:MAG: 3'-5' exonuclease, partial [Galactobacillus timonensis]|nr:3'-5' exonuclease [Galactobacillus timonensis]
LRHMILSHHGKLEFGSPMMPEIPEAEALFLIDNMDARMNTLKQVLDGVKPGSWSQRVFALDNRQFYKPREMK